MLYGEKWRDDSYKPFGLFPFLKKRCLRIFIPLWIVVLAVVPFEYLVTGRFEVFTIVMNAIGLGWVRPFGISGHLWYITMLLILYFCFVIFSRTRFDKIKWHSWLIGFCCLIAFYFMAQNILNTYSTAGPPLFVFFSALIFFRGKDLLALAKNNRNIVAVAALAVVAISQYVFQLGWYDSKKSLAICSFICAGFLSFLALSSFINDSKGNKIIRWLSDISYEIYLVHLPLMPISRMLIDNKFIWTIVWVIFTLACAKVLNSITSKIYNTIKNYA